MDMGTHIETIILIFRSVRVTLAHFKVKHIKFFFRNLIYGTLKVCITRFL